MKRECGICGLCCKLLGIVALEKPQGSWCSFYTPGKGCDTYDTRPNECRKFSCLWLTGHLPLDLSPLKTHCVLWISTLSIPGSKDGVTLRIMEDNGYKGNAENFFWSYILALTSQNYSVEIYTGKDKRAVNKIDIPLRKGKL